MHEHNLLHQKAQRRDRNVLVKLRVPHHLNLRPAMARFPQQIRQKNRQRDQSPHPDPLSNEIRATGPPAAVRRPPQIQRPASSACFPARRPPPRQTQATRPATSPSRSAPRSTRTPARKEARRRSSKENCRTPDKPARTGSTQAARNCANRPPSSSRASTPVRNTTAAPASTGIAATKRSYSPSSMTRTPRPSARSAVAGPHSPTPSARRKPCSTARRGKIRSGECRRDAEEVLRPPGPQESR